MPLAKVFIVAVSALYASMTSWSTSQGEAARSSTTQSLTAINIALWRCTKLSSYLLTFAASSVSIIGFSASYARLAFRYPQDDGQSISISRLVPQHTAQICSPFAGQYRFPNRSEHNGHIAITAEVCDNRKSIATGWGVSDWQRFEFRTASPLKMRCGASSERFN